MLRFDNVRRGTNITVVPVLDSDKPAIRHWLKEMNVTGWQLCDAKTVRQNLGEDYPLAEELPVWPDMPEFSMTNMVSYFVSFYNAGDISAKLAEIISSRENTEWVIKMAQEDARDYAYENACAMDPAPFDFRRDLEEPQ